MCLIGAPSSGGSPNPLLKATFDRPVGAQDCFRLLDAYGSQPGLSLSCTSRRAKQMALQRSPLSAVTTIDMKQAQEGTTSESFDVNAALRGPRSESGRNLSEVQMIRSVHFAWLSMSTLSCSHSFRFVCSFQIEALARQLLGAFQICLSAQAPGTEAKLLCHLMRCVKPGGHSPQVSESARGPPWTTEARIPRHLASVRTSDGCVGWQVLGS